MTGRRIQPAPRGASDASRLIEARLTEVRGEVSALYRILLNSPPVCDGWERLLTAVRQQSSLNPRLRELIILRIAILNRAPYEFAAHVPHGRKAGLSEAEMDLVKGDGRSSFSEVECIALEYTDAMTRHIQVPDELFARVKTNFDARGLVDLTVTIAAYNMVSRFLVALDVH